MSADTFERLVGVMGPLPGQGADLPPGEDVTPAEWGEPPPQETGGPPAWEAVIEDMRSRDRFGREKYGTPLQAGNGRDALKDAYEEALDLAVYLKQAILERPTVAELVDAMTPEARGDFLSLWCGHCGDRQP